MIIAYTGLDGSGKTYHMAEICLKMLDQGFDCFSTTPIKGARLLESDKQIVRCERAHIFFDEWHQDHDAKGWYNFDPILRHMVTQHRKYHLVIHWSAQHFLFMDSYVRRETTFVWEHEALYRDKNSGISRVQFKMPYVGEIKGLHKAFKYAGWEAELKHKHPKILESKHFFILPSVYKNYDSYKKILLTNVNDEELQKIKDPYYTEPIENVKDVSNVETTNKRELMTAPNPAVDSDTDFVDQQDPIYCYEETEDDVKLVNRQENPYHLNARME